MKTTSIRIRCTTVEAEAIRRKAESRGLTVSEFLRRMSLATPPDEVEALRDELRNLTKAYIHQGEVLRLLQGRKAEELTKE